MVDFIDNMIKNKDGNFILDDLANKLQGRYTWLQLFLTSDHVLEIFFSKNSEIHKDLQYLNSIIQPAQIKLMKNYNMHVGLNKYPLVWANKQHRISKFKCCDIQLI